MMQPFQIRSANPRARYSPGIDLLARSTNIDINVPVGGIALILRGSQRLIDFEHYVFDRPQHRQAPRLLARTARPPWRKELMTETLRPNRVCR
jgi:hypothetical protein